MDVGTKADPASTEKLASLAILPRKSNKSVKQINAAATQRKWDVGAQEQVTHRLNQGGS